MDEFRDHARRELVFLALGTMDVCVVAPLFAALLSPMLPVRPLSLTALFLGAVLAVHYLARLTLALPLQPRLRSGLLGLGMLVSGLLLVHQLFHVRTRILDPTWLVDIFSGLRQGTPSHEVPVFLLVLFLWWRGLVLAQRRLDSVSVAFRFRLGLLMLAVTTALGGSMLSWPHYRFVFVFFFASLLGIALARAEEVGHQYGGSQSPFGVGWLATLVVADLVVLLLAGGLAALLTGENISLLLVPALQVLHIVLFYTIYAVAWIAQIVIAPLIAILQQEELRRTLEELSRRIAPSGLMEPQEVQPGELPFTAEQLALARAVGIIGGVLLVLLLIALSLRRLRARAGWRRDEERESVWEGAHLRRGLGDLLRHGRHRLDEAAAALGRSLLGRLFAAMTIRRIYAHLGALAAERGYPRASYETPYEYLPTLEQAFPDSREEVARITEAYVAVHYGEVPERAGDLAAVQAAWEHIRETAGIGPHQRRRVPRPSGSDT
jgi:hypothetical protein